MEQGFKGTQHILVNLLAVDLHLSTNARPFATILTTSHEAPMFQLFMVLQVMDIIELYFTPSTFYTSWQTHQEERQWQIAWYVMTSHMILHILISMIFMAT